MSTLRELYNKTELSDSILTSDEARAMYNNVSPIYGNSYVALWLFQVIGSELDRIKQFTEELADQQNPETATWSLPLWEERYGITPGADWTTARRRDAIISKRKYNAPITPKKLCDMASAIAGVPVDIAETEDIDEAWNSNDAYNPYYFTLFFRQNTTKTKVTEALEAARAATPAYIYICTSICPHNDSALGNYIATGVSEHKTYFVEVS